MKKDKRFEIIHKETHGMITEVSILRDKQTGEQYLFVKKGPAGGLTPLLNQDSKI